MYLTVVPVVRLVLVLAVAPVSAGADTYNSIHWRYFQHCLGVRHEAQRKPPLREDSPESGFLPLDRVNDVEGRGPRDGVVGGGIAGDGPGSAHDLVHARGSGVHVEEEA